MTRHNLSVSQPNRTDREEVIRKLCERYPACFFEEGNKRRPLKKNIAADIIIDDDFKVADEMIIAAVDWYKGHIGYDYNTIAGTKRIDLNGRDVTAITMQEALAAKQRIYEFNARRNEQQRITNNPIRVLAEMRTNGQISDCTVKKQDAPMQLKSRVAPVPEYAALFEVLTTANATVASISDPAMRAAVAKPLLDHMIAKIQQVRSELD
jgi:sRNA-binding protein